MPKSTMNGIFFSGHLRDPALLKTPPWLIATPSPSPFGAIWVTPGQLGETSQRGSLAPNLSDNGMPVESSMTLANGRVGG